MINKNNSKMKNIDNSDKQSVNLFGEVKKSSTKSKRPVKKEPRIDPRNKLNNLNGAEWQYWTKTVLNKHNIKDIRVFKFIFTKSYNCDFETVYSAFREELNNYLKYI